MECKAEGCKKPRGGRNTLCWMHLKRKVRMNQAIKNFKRENLLEEDLDLPYTVLSLGFNDKGVLTHTDGDMMMF